MSFVSTGFPPPSRRLSLSLAMGVAVSLHVLLLTLVWHARPSLQAPRPEPLPIVQIELIPRPDTPSPERPDRVAEHNQRSDQTRIPETAALTMPPPPPPMPTAKNTAPAPAAPAMPPMPAPAKPAPSTPAHKGKHTETAPPPPPPPPTAEEPLQSLTERSLQMNRLRSDILEQSLRGEVNAHSAVLTANTVYGPEAAYLRAWVEKVERIGNLHFPDEARRRHLSGRLILEVKLDAQGQVLSVRVRQSSGEPILDTAAEDIVRLAAPFAPFPAELRMKYDQLSIIRTWVFDAGRGLDTR